MDSEIKLLNGSGKLMLKRPALVPAVEQASRVLLCLAENRRSKMSLTDLCAQVGIAKSKGHSILNTLKQFDFVEKDCETKAWSLGPNLLYLSQRVLDNLSYPEIVAPFLDGLARETNGTPAFGLISGAHLLIVAKHEGNQNIGFALPLGHRFHITLGAHGKAIAAFMNDADREELLTQEKLYFYGDASRIDMRRIRAELDECRAVGFAQDIGNVTSGVNVVSAPVFGFHDRMVGCVILIGTFAAAKVQEYGPKVVCSAKQISRKLGANTQAIFPT